MKKKLLVLVILLGIIGIACKFLTSEKEENERIVAELPRLTQERIIQGYCLKCRSSRVIKDAQQITMKNGRPATRGTCPTCGSKMSRIGKV